MIKVLIMGGTFDPPHLGHEEIFKNAVAAIKPDEVYIIPAGTPPHKKASLTDAYLRLEMCQCFLEVCPNANISDMEIKREGKSYTFETLKQIRQNYANKGIDAKIYLCIGSDMLFSFLSWKNAMEIIKDTALVCGMRKKGENESFFKAADELKKLGAELIFAKGYVNEMSSSEIRDMLKNPQQRKAGLAMLPNLTAEFVEKQQLYE